MIDDDDIAHSLSLSLSSLGHHIPISQNSVFFLLFSLILLFSFLFLFFYLLFYICFMYILAVFFVCFALLCNQINSKCFNLQSKPFDISFIYLLYINIYYVYINNVPFCWFVTSQTKSFIWINFFKPHPSWILKCTIKYTMNYMSTSTTI